MKKKIFTCAVAAAVVAAAALGITPQLQKSDIKADITESPKETEPVTGITHAGSYEELYDLVREWKENSSNDAIQPRAMTVEESADAVGTSEADMGASDSMVVTMPEEPIDTEFGYDPSSDMDYSTTTRQEELVDEADIVKTDGNCIYAMDSKGTLRIVDAASMKILSELNGESSAYYKELYVDGDCLQLIRQQEEYVTYQGTLNLLSAAEDSEESDGVRTVYSMPVTTVTVETYDISDKENPKLAGSCQQDGSYLSSRRNNGRLYLFTSYKPDLGDDAEQLQYYVPRIGGSYIACDHIYLPTPEEDFSYNGKVYLVAGAVSPENPSKATDRMAVVSNANVFYVSENNIYSATTIWNDQETRTELVRIGYQDGEFTDGAAGSVKGELHNNFSMNEVDGNLRVVTTTEGWDKDYTNFMRDNGLYVLDSELKIIGKIEDLAEGEQVKAARFVGNMGYFVTYRNTDPLFAVDLSDPENPEVTGELQITGFSEYLHFYGENKLLGIGWETDPDTGNVDGMKCSMFDISDPENVREIDRFILKDVSFCESLSNYRSILASPKKNLFGFAYGIYGNNNDVYDSSENYYYGLFSYDEENGFAPQMYLNMKESGLSENDMSYQDYRRARGVYIGDMFYLVTEEGIASYNMQNDYKQAETLRWEA